MTEQFYELYHGDCSDILPTLAEGSVDAVITDPPYDRKSLALFEILAKESGRILKRGGSLLTYYGQYALPEILNMFHPHLRFWWQVAIKHGGNSARLMGKRLFVDWKPMLWFVKEVRGYENFVADFYQSQPTSKDLHKWQQDVSEFAYYTEKVTPVGGLVLDPFMGSGTTGIAAIQTGRSFIGIEIEEGYFNTAQERIEKAWEETEQQD